MLRSIPASLCALLAAACLSPLPPAEPLPCARVDWNCFRQTLPDRTDCDPFVDAGCVRLESPVRSTVRVHFRDVLLLRKWREQRPRFACTSLFSSGFTATTLRDGDPLLTAFVKEPAGSKPYIVLAYGLYDSCGSRYVRLIAESLAAAGYGVVVPEMPWHGCRLRVDDPQSLSTLGAVEAEELLAWGRAIRDRRPGARVALLGFSLGALNAIHVLSLPDSQRVFDGALAVSPPGDLVATMARLDERGSLRRDGGVRLIRFFFRSNLAARLRALRLRPARKPFAQYVEHLGAGDAIAAAEVLDRASPEKALPRVGVPLLIIASADDPVFAASAAHALEVAAARNDCALVLETPFGGHIGHMGTAPKWFASIMDAFFGNLDSIAAR